MRQYARDDFFTHDFHPPREFGQPHRLWVAHDVQRAVRVAVTSGLWDVLTPDLDARLPARPRVLWDDNR